MIDVLRSETIKLRTIRVPWILVLSGVGIILLIVGLSAALVDVDDLMTDTTFIDLLVGPMVLVGLLLGVVGALAITTEHGHGTIKVTFAAVPHRSRVLAAKALVLMALAIVVSVGLLAVTTVGAIAILDGRGGSYSPFDERVQRDALPGAVVLVLILTMLGYGLGLLMRSSPGAIVTLVLWPLLLENLVGALLYAAGQEQAAVWLPYQAGFSLLQTGGDTGDVDLPSRWVGGAVFGGVTLVILLVGWVLTLRRDA